MKKIALYNKTFYHAKGSLFAFDEFLGIKLIVLI